MKKWNIGWGITSKCNMNCKFCYSKFNRKEEIDCKYDDWIRFIDENGDKINTINYGTGENTIDINWYKLISHVRDKYPQIRQSLTTNGYLSEMIKNNKELYNVVVKSIDEIDVSIDFYDNKKHNEFRGQAKAYDWAIDTLKFCKENNISATIVFLGSKLNLFKENIDGIFKIAKENNALVRMNIYRPTEGINEFSEKFILESKDILDILYYISEEYQILSISDALFSSVLTNSFEEDPSGIDSLRILPNGNITPSTYLISENYMVGNIKEKDILTKIEKSNKISNIIHVLIPIECSNCIYKDKCKGGVYDRRYLWNNTIEKKDPYCFVENNMQYKKLKICTEKFESVHHGYLPTMFFKFK